jgi:hypothetical protein
MPERVWVLIRRRRNQATGATATNGKSCGQQQLIHRVLFPAPRLFRAGNKTRPTNLSRSQAAVRDRASALARSGALCARRLRVIIGETGLPGREGLTGSPCATGGKASPCSPSESGETGLTRLLGALSAKFLVRLMRFQDLGGGVSSH